MLTTWFARTALVLLAACSRSVSGNDDPPPQPPEPVRFDKPAMVRFHMQSHFDDLRAIQQDLLAGKLEDARTRAFLLTKPAPDPGMARWEPDVAAVSAAARALGDASSIDEALRRETRVAVACAGCHLHVQVLPAFGKAPSVDRDDGTTPARMLRHRWAADRLWEGLVGPSDASWRSGLEVLAATPLTFAPVTDAPALSARLQRLATTAITTYRSGRESLDHRARLYGEMLVTCAACHTSLAVSAR